MVSDLATYTARRSLKVSGPLTILVDNTVLGHAVTHETAWISPGTQLWGGKHPIETCYSARVPVHPIGSSAPEYQPVRYLTGIAHLARRGHLQLKTSAELNDETFRQPGGRFTGCGYFDYSLFRGVSIESVDGFVGPSLGPKWMNLPSAAEQQRTRLDQSHDLLYRELVGVLGPKNSQDAWHIRTAEAQGLFCFLTMDFKLRRAVERAAAKEPMASLKTKVLTPEGLGRRLGLVPLPPHFFSYTDASYPVRADLSMPGGKRWPVSSYRKRT